MSFSGFDAKRPRMNPSPGTVPRGLHVRRPRKSRFFKVKAAICSPPARRRGPGSGRKTAACLPHPRRPDRPRCRVSLTQNLPTGVRPRSGGSYACGSGGPTRAPKERLLKMQRLALQISRVRSGMDIHDAGAWVRGPDSAFVQATKSDLAGLVRCICRTSYPEPDHTVLPWNRRKQVALRGSLEYKDSR
jgi:hypothetical protein